LLIPDAVLYDEFGASKYQHIKEWKVVGCFLGVPVFTIFLTLFLEKLRQDLED